MKTPRTIFLALMLAHGPAAAQVYTIRTIGPAADSTSFSSVALDINNQGEVLASGVFGPFNYSPALYLPRAAYGIPAGLNALIQYGGSMSPVAINDRGQIAAQSGQGAVVWQNQVQTALGNLGGGSASITAMNEAGMIVGTSRDENPNSLGRAFLVYPGESLMKLLPGLPPGELGGAISVNNRGQIIGNYGRLVPAPPPSPPGSFFSENQTFLWEAGRFFDMAALIGVNDHGGGDFGNANRVNVRVLLLNDAGTILGTVTSSIDGVNSGYGFLFGGPEGFRGTSGLSSAAYSINSAGQILFGDRQSALNFSTVDPQPQYFLWKNDVAVNIDTLIPPGSGWSRLIPRKIKNNGVIVGTGRLNGRFQAFVLEPPKLTASVSAEPRRVQSNETIQVELTLRNNDTEAFTGILPTGPLQVDGSNLVQLMRGPVPAHPLALAPGQYGHFVYEFKAVSEGRVQFHGAGTGQVRGQTVISLRADSPSIYIGPRGDLLIKSATQPDAAFASDNVYSPYANEDQTEKTTIARGGTNSFEVKVQNDSRTAHSFFVKALDATNANWTTTFLDGGTDITAAIRSANGWQTSALASNAFQLITIRMHANTNAADGSSQRATLSLRDRTNAVEALDVIEARSDLSIVPVEGILRVLSATGYTSTNIDAGNTNVDAPLEPRPDAGILRGERPIFGGLVADGVTPLLLHVRAGLSDLDRAGGEREFHPEIELVGGGQLSGASLQSRFRQLQNGAWGNVGVFTLTEATNEVFLYLGAIGSDELLFDPGKRELNIRVRIVDTLSKQDAGEIKFRIRKPPVALIHGYNTAGNWGDGFIRQMGRSRPLNDDPWVRVARYGVGNTAGEHVSQRVNTLYPFDDLVPLAEAAFDEAIAPLRLNWAFTRFDAVCHSQGGLLTRMLCSEKTSRTLSRPFRNELNHYRGRFHRVVTIGSPHNGTRLLRYVLALNETKLSLLKNNLPTLISYVGVFSEIAQAKFDPFGVQIRDLNNPSPGSRWKPDPAAKFHLVRTTINLGQAPYVENLSPTYTALGLFHPVGGIAVLPRGSDGVVDFDSMGANAPGQAIGTNVFVLSPSNLVSHAGPLYAFGADASQTASADVGLHVIGALDQDPAVPLAERVYSSFVMAQLLDDTIRQQIDDWANVSIFEYLGAAINPTPPVFGPQAAGISTDLNFTLTTPQNLPVANQVSWSVEAFTASGIASDGTGIELQVDPLDSRRVTVRVPADLVGDVVLYASYATANGAVVLVAPREIFSTEPSGATLVGIAVEPNNERLPAGSEVPIEVATLYSDGQRILRRVERSEVTAVSSATDVVSTTNTIVWRLLSPGAVTITVSYRGQTATNQLTVFTPVLPDAPSLFVTRQAAGQVILRWPVAATNYVLESTAALSPGSLWQTVSNVPAIVGGNIVVTIPTAIDQRFYRLKR